MLVNSQAKGFNLGNLFHPVLKNRADKRPGRTAPLELLKNIEGEPENLSPGGYSGTDLPKS